MNQPDPKRTADLNQLLTERAHLKAHIFVVQQERDTWRADYEHASQQRDKSDRECARLRKKLIGLQKALASIAIIASEAAGRPS